MKKIVSGCGEDLDRLYEAVVAYVEANHGSVIVVGGVQIIDTLRDKSGNFTVGVKCTGTKPRFE
jgi:hypothetical protein